MREGTTFDWTRRARVKPARAQACATAPAPVRFVMVACTLFFASSLDAQLPDSTQRSESTEALDTIPMRAPLPEVVLTHLAYLTDAFAETPGGMGLIPTGMAEAEIAAEYVRLAGQDATNLGQMVRSMAHVLHAIDPNEVGNGFGLGYGVKRAAEGVLEHIEVVVNTDGVSENVLFHVGYAAEAAYGTLLWAEQAIALARRIQRATEPKVALSMINDLAALVRAMAYGDDADGDGRIGYRDTESGLAQATYHLTLLRRVEGLGGC